MNLLLKVSRFFHDIQVNVLLTKIFLDFLFQKALLIIFKHKQIIIYIYIPNNHLLFGMYIYIYT